MALEMNFPARLDLDDCKDTDDEEYCKELKGNGFCETHETQMREKCHKTCEFCSKLISP